MGYSVVNYLFSRIPERCRSKPENFPRYTRRVSYPDGPEMVRICENASSNVTVFSIKHLGFALRRGNWKTNETAEDKWHIYIHLGTTFSNIPDLLTHHGILTLHNELARLLKLSQQELDQKPIQSPTREKYGILLYDQLHDLARWSYLARSGLLAAARKKHFPESHIINPLLPRLVRSRWLDIGLVFFCEFMDLDSASIHKHAKKELGNIQPS